MTKQLDRDIPLRTWQCYIKKYKDRYLLNCDEIGIWQIRLKQNLGFIQPYSIVKKQLVAVMTFRSRNQKTFFIKKMKRTTDFSLKITQDGEQELCIVFNEKNIKQLENLFKIRKRYKFSKKEIEKRTLRLKKYTKAKQEMSNFES